MGKEQRSRSKLNPGTLCYLCLEPLLEGQPWDRDHVPPQRIFGKDLRRQFGLQLEWLPTHRVCNNAAKSDEEYFVLALAGHHRTPTGEAVWRDIERGAKKGHALGLIKRIVGQFGTVTLADGSTTFGLEPRAKTAAWKIIRGLYALRSPMPLSVDQPHLVEIVPRSETGRRLADHPWFPLVRDTEPLGRYGAVFDYKWIGIPVLGIRAHGFAMLLWDSLIVTGLFHDPSCTCKDCRKSRTVTAVPQA